MIEKPLDRIQRGDLDALVTNQTHEGRTLDYKRDLPGSSNDEKKEFARDVSSFANAAGGDIVYGVEEAKDSDGKNLGYPEKLVGVDARNFDATKLRLDSMLRDNIDPRIQGVAFHKVDGFDRGPIVIIRIAKSWLAPHMVTFQNQTHFYSRNSAGKQPLDVREIRGAFGASANAVATAKRFRDERIGRVLAGQTPVVMRKDQGERRVVLHTLPLDVDATINIRKLAKNPNSMPPPYASSGWRDRFNLDGFVTYAGPSITEQRTYCQAFRAGQFESVVVPVVDATARPPQLLPLPLERIVLDAFKVHLRLLRAHGVGSPLVMATAIIGLAGYRVYPGQQFDYEMDDVHTLTDDVLILPDIVVVEGEPPLEPLLRPMFDALWQAGGFERSLGYDEEGVWQPHR